MTVRASIRRETRWSHVYAVGDIHGRLDLLLQLEAQMRQDAAREQARQPAICYLGDLIDRGPDSRGVIEYLANPPADGFERIALMGNHEDRMLAFLASAEIGEAWMKNGARQAMASYGLAVPEKPSANQFESLRRQLCAALPDHHARYLTGLELALAWRDYVFVHAGIDPDRPLDRQRRRDLLWIREPFLSSPADHGVIVVHGHVPAGEPQVRFNRIGIDTGAWKSGRLTCAVLDGTGLRFLHT